MIFGISWFVEFSLQTDKHNYFVSFDLDAEQFTAVAIYTVVSFAGIEIYNAD